MYPTTTPIIFPHRLFSICCNLGSISIQIRGTWVISCARRETEQQLIRHMNLLFWPFFFFLFFNRSEWTICRNSSSFRVLCINNESIRYGKLDPVPDGERRPCAGRQSVAGFKYWIKLVISHLLAHKRKPVISNNTGCLYLSWFAEILLISREFNSRIEHFRRSGEVRSSLLLIIIIRVFKARSGKIHAGDHDYNHTEIK